MLVSYLTTVDNELRLKLIQEDIKNAILHAIKHGYSDAHIMFEFKKSGLTDFNMAKRKSVKFKTNISDCDIKLLADKYLKQITDKENKNNEILTNTRIFCGCNKNKLFGCTRTYIKIY